MKIKEIFRYNWKILTTSIVILIFSFLSNFSVCSIVLVFGVSIPWYCSYIMFLSVFSLLLTPTYLILDFSGLSLSNLSEIYFLIIGFINAYLVVCGLIWIYNKIKKIK